jgi:hypothetical protein
MKALSIVAPFLLVTACSDGGGKKPMIIPDAPNQQIDAPQQAACSAASTFTMATNFSFDYTADRDTMTTGNQEVWTAIGDLNADTLVDWLWIELYEGAPPNFTTLDFPAPPFTIQLAGNELDYNLCSMCITLTTDVDLDMSMQQNSLVYADDYMAVSGAVKITALTSTTITGELQNVKMNHVDITMDGTMSNASGCKTDGPATLPFTAQMMAFENGHAKYGVKLPNGVKVQNLRRPVRR